MACKVDAGSALSDHKQYSVGQEVTVKGDSRYSHIYLTPMD